MEDTDLGYIRMLCWGTRELSQGASLLRHYSQNTLQRFQASVIRFSRPRALFLSSVFVFMNSELGTREAGRDAEREAEVNGYLMA